AGEQGVDGGNVDTARSEQRLHLAQLALVRRRDDEARGEFWRGHVGVVMVDSAMSTRSFRRPSPDDQAVAAAARASRCLTVSRSMPSFASAVSPTSCAAVNGFD